MAKGLLGVDLTPGQGRIAALAAFGHRKRVCITAHTRYGKTYAMAVGICLGIMLHDGKPLRWVVLAPTLSQAAILRGYVADIIVENRLLTAHVEFEQTQDISRLRREVSKTKMTFKDGQQLLILSAEGGGERLMGFGADRLIVDEAALIADAVFTKRILRMLGDNPGAVLLLITNPWHSSGFFGRAWSDEDYLNIRIGFDVGLVEGRITQETIDEARRHLSPSEFQVLYEARFPDAAEDQLIPWDWIQRSVVAEAPMMPAEAKRFGGLDVAEGGRDKCVHVQGWSHGGDVVLSSWDAWHGPDTMTSVARVESGHRGGVLAVDGTGVGKPVADRLKQLGIEVLEVKTGRKAKHTERFVNLGSEALWNLRRLFEEEKVRLVNPPHALLTDLAMYRFDTASGRLRVKVEGGKEAYSPDFGDATSYACLAVVRAKGAALPRAIPRRRSL